MVARTRGGRQILRYDFDLPTADVLDEGAGDMALYAGQGVASCTTRAPAVEIVTSMAVEARRCLRRAAGDG